MTVDFVLSECPLVGHCGEVTVYYKCRHIHTQIQFVFSFMSTSGLRCKPGSIGTRTTHVRWSEAGIPGTETRTRLVSSSAQNSKQNRKHDENKMKTSY